MLQQQELIRVQLHLLRLGLERLLLIQALSIKVNMTHTAPLISTHKVIKTKWSYKFFQGFDWAFSPLIVPLRHPWLLMLIDFFLKASMKSSKKKQTFQSTQY